MAAEWQRLVATTIADYTYGVEDYLVAKRVLMAMLKKAGQIVFNSHGLTKNWQTEHRIAPLTVNNGEQTVSPARQNRYQQPLIDYIGYVNSDAMTKREKLKNKGKEALVDYFEDMAKRLSKDFMQKLSEELYVDSTVAANADRLSGIETMMGTNGTVNITTGGQRSANAADIVGYPNATYAGLSCILGNYSGVWGGGTAQTDLGSTWPNSRGDLGYDFWTPLIVNTTSTAWGAPTATFPDTCVLCTRFAAITMQRYESERGQMKTILYDREFFREYLNKIDSKERIAVSSTEGLRALGFEDTFRQDGVDIIWEFGMPPKVGYGFNADEMFLHSMQDKLMDVRGPTWHDLNNYYYVIIDFLGQMQFTAPRFFAKLVSLA